MKVERFLDVSAKKMSYNLCIAGGVVRHKCFSDSESEEINNNKYSSAQQQAKTSLMKGINFFYSTFPSLSQPVYH